MIDVGNNISTALPLFLTSSCPCAYGIVLALQTCAVCISRPMPARQPHRLRSGTSLRDTTPLSRLVSQSQHRCTVPVLLAAPLRARLPTLSVARYGTTAHSASQYSLSLILLLGYHLLSGLNVLFLMPLSSMLILKSPARTIPTDLILCFCLASILVQTMSNYFRFSESRRKKFLRSEIWVVFEFYGVPQHQADLALYVRSKNTCSFIIRTVDTHV